MSSNGNGLTSLPPLPPLGDNQSPSGVPSVGRIVLGAVTGGLSNLPGVSEIPAMIGKSTGANFSIQSIVVIVLGLLFIAAGIFAFKEVRQTVVTTGKAAAKVAMV